MLSTGGVERAAEDARGATRPRRVRARDHEPGEGAPHDPVAHPALRVLAPARRRDQRPASLDVLDARASTSEPDALAIDRPRGRRLGPRRRVAARPGARARDRPAHRGRGRAAARRFAVRARMAILDAIAAEDVAGGAHRLAALLEPGTTPAGSPRTCSRSLRDAFLLTAGAGRVPSTRPRTSRRASRASATRSATPSLVRALETLGQAVVDMRGTDAADPRLVLEIALVRLARRDTGGRCRCSRTGSSGSSSASPTVAARAAGRRRGAAARAASRGEAVPAPRATAGRRRRAAGAPHGAGARGRAAGGRRAALGAAGAKPTAPPPPRPDPPPPRPAAAATPRRRGDASTSTTSSSRGPRCSTRCRDRCGRRPGGAAAPVDGDVDRVRRGAAQIDTVKPRFQQDADDDPRRRSSSSSARRPGSSSRTTARAGVDGRGGPAPAAQAARDPEPPDPPGARRRADRPRRGRRARRRADERRRGGRFACPASRDAFGATVVDEAARRPRSSPWRSRSRPQNRTR